METTKTYGLKKLSQSESEQWYVYILECSDKTLYVGITNNLDRRISKHNNGTGAKYTKGRAPVTLLKYFIVNSKSEALKLEIKIKKMSRKDKIELKKINKVDSPEESVIVVDVTETDSLKN